MSLKLEMLSVAALVLLLCAIYVNTGSISNQALAASETITTADDNDNASLPDFDGDGTIGIGDFVLFAGVFGSSQGDEKYDARYDLNGDGEIGFVDFLIFTQNFGKEVPSPVVSIPDDNLRAAIEDALDKASGAPITQADMATLTSILAIGENISDLTGLEFATNLKRLDLAYNYVISDISALARLTSLTDLYLQVNKITDISVLAGLTNLTSLNLSDNNVKDISPLSGLTDLTSLSLSGKNIKDISPLSGLTDLTSLGLYGTSITQVSALAGLTNLTELFVPDNKLLSDITGLAGLTHLTRLDLAYNDHLSDIAALAGLTNLERLDLQENNISDITPLADLANLSWLDLAYNYVISDISALARLTSLTDLYLQVNKITDISVLAGLTNLVVLNVSHNEITDLSALSGLAELREVFLSDNNIHELAPLGDNVGLGAGDVVNVTANPLDGASKDTHIPALQGRGVRVVFDEIVVFPGPQVYNDNLFVLPVTENLAAVGNLDLPLQDYAARFYEHFNDEFDFLVFVTNLDGTDLEPHVNAAAGVYLGVRNDVQGIGKSHYSNGSWGSSRNLQGVISFGFISLWDIAQREATILKDGPLLHELMHRWANFIVKPKSWQWDSHWGTSSANGRLGGFDIADLVDHGGGRYTAAEIAPFGRSHNQTPYSPIELYLAGFAPSEEVPDLWVAEDGAWLKDEADNIVRADNGEMVFTASRVKTYEIEDIIEEYGPRVPDYSRSQKDFKAAVILLISKEFPATRTNLQTLSADVSWFSHAGEDQIAHKYNFHEATGGRGAITMSGLSQLRRSGGAKKAVPHSFGTPPPPIVDYLE